LSGDPIQGILRSFAGRTCRSRQNSALPSPRCQGSSGSARGAGCGSLFAQALAEFFRAEDFADGSVIEGVRFLDPFSPSFKLAALAERLRVE
jgi:hypothetical protein